MNTVFADTSFYLAFALPRDFLHESSLEWSRNFHGHIITTDFVLIETANALSRVPNRRVCDRLFRLLSADSATTVVSASRDLVDAGFGVFTSRPDKDWSLTDCISFVVMQQHHLRDALTADHHFEQAGFNVLLK